MAEFSEKIQALMDDVYAEWQKEENKGKGKWDVLEGFSEAHQIAVVFGNFNYQVENGGIEQWIYNGYFHDDAEKLTEHLEIGAKTDERCRTILDRIYKLDQYAQETDCDRDGYFYDPDDDGESSFIGDAINCEAFDSWYYERCGKEDWWATVCGIIDKTEAHGLAPSVQYELNDAEVDPYDGEPEWAIRAKYCYAGENKERIIETVDYPASKERIDALIKNAGINGIDRQIFFIESIETVIPGLDVMLPDVVNINEINYLAAKIMEMSGDGRGMYAAIIDVKKPIEDMAQLINLAFSDNINRFDVQPAFSEEMYGDFLVNNWLQDKHADAFNRLDNSSDPGDSALARHIEKLEKNIDIAAFGRAAAKEENGVFTNYGYVTGGDGLLEIYRSPEDIPVELFVYDEYPAELRSLSKYITPDADKSELAYLADIIAGMDGEQRRLFDAVAESGWHCNNVTEIINMTQSLDCFTLQPAFNESQYGEYRLMRDWEESREAIARLEKSDNSADRALAKHAVLLNRCADEETYGYHAMKDSGGVMTQHGFLVMDEVPKEIYRGVQDLPAEYRAETAAPEKPRASVDRTVPGEKTSVLEQIAEHREAQRTAGENREIPAPGKKKTEPDL